MVRGTNREALPDDEISRGLRRPIALQSALLQALVRKGVFTLQEPGVVDKAWMPSFRRRDANAAAWPGPPRPVRRGARGLAGMRLKFLCCSGAVPAPGRSGHHLHHFARAGAAGRPRPRRYRGNTGRRCRRENDQGSGRAIMGLLKACTNARAIHPLAGARSRISPSTE